MQHIIGKNKKGKMIKFDNSVDCYNALTEKRIVEWRQIVANSVKEAFIKYNQNQPTNLNKGGVIT